VLSLANPVAFGKALRIRRIVRQIAANMSLTNAWQYELAAMLSQTGCITLPSTLLEKMYTGSPLSKTEQSVFASHPMIAYKLLEDIPRIGEIAGMIRDQLKTYASYATQPYSPYTEDIDLGAQILKVASDYDQLLQNDLPSAEAVKILADRGNDYNPDVLEALRKQEIVTDSWTIKVVDMTTVEIGMIVDQDIFSKDGERLMTKGQEIALPLLERLTAISKSIGIVEPFRVVIPFPASKSDKEETSNTPGGTQHPASL
jgi:hypothetical protein